MREDPEILKVRLDIADTARDMLRGELSFIEGARQLCRLKWVAMLDDHDADFNPFVGIDSDTDALPIGPQAVHWAEDALERLRPEIAKAEARAQEMGRPHCQKLIDRFGE